MPRIVDLALSVFMLIVCAPLIAMIALAIRLESRGPVFYRQERIGKDGRPFQLFKFRKMPEGLPRRGPMLTGRFDPRLTHVGRFLERTKLDELPQLLNVLRGDMTLVGPRPEVRKFVSYYPEKWATVLSVRPGVMGLNQVYHRNESELFPTDCPDIEEYYIHHILPDKLDIDIRYVERRCFWFDLWILLRAAWVTVFGTVTWRSLESYRSYFVILILDTCLGVASYIMAHSVRFSGQVPLQDREILHQMIVAVPLIRALAFAIYEMPRHVPGYFSIHEVGVVLRSVLVGSLGILGYAFLANLRAHSRAIFFIDSAFLAMLLLGYRWGWAWWKHRSGNLEGNPKVVIAGVNHETVRIIQTLQRMRQKLVEVIGVVDTDPTRRGHHIAGVEIIGLAGEMDLLLGVHHIDAVLMVRSALSDKIAERIERICGDHDVKVCIVPELIRTIEAIAAKPKAHET
ncbi:MAG TPA: sugar transferase [bacterium]|nr:sugar transferase [bacterium]